MENDDGFLITSQSNKFVYMLLSDLKPHIYDTKGMQLHHYKVIVLGKRQLLKVEEDMRANTFMRIAPAKKNKEAIIKDFGTV